ncbi:MAG: AMP-binding protein [Verrucomicrobia bacterium]|nr:AMP-binding protein [Verrucomicrobiota bacterium]
MHAHGVPLVCGTAPLPRAIAGDFARWRPTVFPSVPAVWGALAAAELGPAAFTSLRLAISAGAPLPPGVARASIRGAGLRCSAGAARR